MNDKGVTAKTSALALILGLCIFALFASKRPALVGWPNAIVLTRFPVPQSVRIKATNGFMANLTDKDGPALKQMLKSPVPYVRMSAVAGLIRVPSEDAVDIAIEMAKDGDESVRERAYALLVHSRDMRSIPVLIAGLKEKSRDSIAVSAQGLVALKAQEAAPALIEILRNEANPNEFTIAQIYAGNSLSKIANQNFIFSEGSMFCGTPLLEGGQMVADGKKLGGEKGQALAARGQEILTEWETSAAKVKDAARVKNINERQRLLKWWTVNSKHFSPPNHSVERPAAR